MAITYGILPLPKWYIADLVGKPLAGGYLATFSNLDYTQLNPVFQDPAGNFTWPYVTIPNVGKLGILFDENGAQGPFYFQFNSAFPNQLYYLEVYDLNGNLQWTIDNFNSSGSGGGSITSAVNLTNLVNNSVFWRNIGSATTPGIQYLPLCPGSHSGFSNNAAYTNGLYVGPDIFFLKNNTAATDTISFPKFNPGETPFTGDVTPVDYLHYVCGNTPAGETLKCVQIPITKGSQNLTNQSVTITLWARCTGGANTLLLNWFQFFGDGGGQSAAITPAIQTLTLTSSWQKFVVQATVPSIVGKGLGLCGNDALFLQIGFPLGAITTIDLAKPSMYLGNISPASDYLNYDNIDSIINSPRTGDVKIGFDLNPLAGYLKMNDQTIGNVGSGAVVSQQYTFPLYNLLYNNVSDVWAPVSGGRTNNAVVDFAAGKTLTLTKTLGRVLGNLGSGAGVSARSLGETTGTEEVTLTRGQMPVHNHPGSFQYRDPGSTGGAISINSNQSSVQSSQFANIVIQNDGSGQAHPNMQPTSFMSVFIKL